MAKKRKCDFRDCFFELAVPHGEWFDLRKYAYELDVNKGAYYDARIGAVNFWCGPDNKPHDWPAKRIKKLALKYPRDYVGAFFADGLKRGKITLHFSVHARSRADGHEFMSPAYKRLLKGTKEDREWILRQFKLLREHVSLMQKGPSPH
jgi:hypothetical protein